MNRPTSLSSEDRPELLRRWANSCLVTPADVSPSQTNLKVVGVFNPGICETKSEVIMVVRVAEQAREERPGFMALPRWDLKSGGVVIDWVARNDWEAVDVRVVREKRSGRIRLNFTSHFRVFRSRDGRAFQATAEWLRPENEFEEFGIEDPRITQIDGIFYITYVAVSRHGVATALFATEDFRSFRRLGIIFPPENKDVVIFPEKIQERYWALHRPSGASPFTNPEIWMATSPDLRNWGEHRMLLRCGDIWDRGRIGAGTPPLKTAAGWLELYHGNDQRVKGVEIGKYVGAFLLLALDDPGRIIGRSGPVFIPETSFEEIGYVPQVVFPTGMIQREDRISVYYGAADTVTAIVDFSLTEVFQKILPCSSGSGVEGL